jgi:glycosyltransferase involved in cell wall biosynthesis
VRILPVITQLELGGAQQNTLYTCRRLAERGHDVVLAHGPGGILDPAAENGPFLNIVIRSLLRPVSPLMDLAALVALARLVNDFRPDIVHTHSSKAGAIGRLAGRLGGSRKVVHSVHGWSFSRHHPALENAIYQAAERLARRATDALITVSREDLDNGVQLGIVAQDKAQVIRSGIDLDHFREDGPGREEFRREWGIKDDETLVLNLSCFKAQKAPLDFVRAAAIASRQEPSLRFVLAGDGELRKQIQEEALQLGLGDRFLLPGWVDDVAGALRASDVVCLTSLWEGLPRTLVQAKACRRPVLACAVNGVPEIIVDGRDGRLFETHDVEGFAENFVKLARRPDLRRRWGQSESPRLQEFDQELMVDQQEALYEGLLTGD